MIRIATTENGSVRGLPAADPRITSFKGIPFAAPPTGVNRWRAPQPAANWDGIRDAYAFAPISMQDTPGIGTDIYCREWHVDPEIPISEDCLYLNVWTGAMSTEDKLPVLVWIYGGALQWGYPAEMEMDGERLARRGVIVVSLSYRLAAFGFLAHPEITKNQPDAPTNFGNLDQQAAIRWVKRNIAAFGGDPENITIAGQSAGGFSVMSQMACLANEGLFQRAIVMSGMFHSPYERDSFVTPKTLSEAEKLGEDFFAHLGVKTLEEARALDACEIREKNAEFRKAHPWFATVQDGQFCRESPYDAFLHNRRVRVPVMSGNTGNEFFKGLAAADEEEFEKKIRGIFGDDAEKFLAFPEARMKDESGFAPVSVIEHAIKAAFLGESKGENPNPCYYYFFNPDIPGWDNPGAFHSVDLWFFFETLMKCWRPFRGRHYELARLMSNYWANFCRTGDPNGEDDDGSRMPEWKPFGPGDRAEMTFVSEGAVPKTDTNPFSKFIEERIYQDITKGGSVI